MEIKLPYGQETILLDVPEKNLLAILKPNPLITKPAINTADLQQSLGKFLKGSKNILIIVNDYTRPTPTVDIIAMIESEIKDFDFRLIVACGSHRGPTEKELVQIFGKYAELYKDRILVHDAKDDSKLKFLGKTRRGIPVWLNQAVWEADKIIVINSVEPHYFAGYTGARKSFLPGVAGLETITANHKLSLQPQAKTLALQGNPVHEDMTEIAQMVPRDIFSIQTVISAEHELYSVRYGDIVKSFETAVADANLIFCVPITEKADIVIALIQAPYDINFYQSQKAMENAKLALKDKGIMIAMSECRDGIGDDEFIKVIAASKDPQETLARIDKHFKLGYHKAAKLVETMMWAEIWTVMPIRPAPISRYDKEEIKSTCLLNHEPENRCGVEDNVVESVFMTPFPNLNVALQRALEKKGPDAKIIILPDASLTVPLCK